MSTCPPRGFEDIDPDSLAARIVIAAIAAINDVLAGVDRSDGDQVATPGTVTIIIPDRMGIHANDRMSLATWIALERIESGGQATVGRDGVVGICRIDAVKVEH